MLQILNGKLIGKWQKFPTTKEQFNTTLSAIGIIDQNYEWFTTDYDIYSDNIKDKIDSFLLLKNLTL